MSPVELVAVLVVGFIGASCTCLLLVALGAWIIREHRDEARFRQELRLAHRIEAQRMADEIGFVLDLDTYQQQVAERAVRQ